jgi:hypothetical protein
LEGYILDEDFPLDPGSGEDESAGLRTSPRGRLVEDHNPATVIGFESKKKTFRKLYVIE